MQQNYSVIIDPRVRFNYASWYILGIINTFGGGAVEYNVKPFKYIRFGNEADLNSGLAFVVKSKFNATEQYKIFIDFEDVAKVFQDRYDWADVYGKVNPTDEQVANYPRLMAIGPQFGITLYSLPQVMALCLTNYFKGYKYNSLSIKHYLKDYLYTIVRRRRITDYVTSCDVRDNYAFHASTLWYNRFARTHTNRYRGEFLRALKKAGVETEGGLYYLGESYAILREMPDYARYKTEYKDFIFEKRLSPNRYIRKTQESFVVFNTPSVCECHGWKLAEYLCMGKAIISTPLTRVMPGEGLIHGRNVHIVNNEAEIIQAVLRLRDDKEYRHTLENGAREYYERYIAPDVVIKRLMHHLKIRQID